MCAQCSGMLAPSRFEPANLLLDVCASHGTWFDANELWTMAQHFEMHALLVEEDVLAFGREMEAYRRAEMGRDFRAAGLLVGILRR